MIALGASPIAAQSFLQSLFGIGNKPTAPPRTAPYPGQPGVLHQGGPLYSPYQRPSRRDSETPADEEGASQSRPGKGRYRTMCVRMCDGFYFPISQATNRAGVSRDADRCAASCGAEARVFYSDDSDGAIDDMADLTGRVYSKLPNAYLYRKRLIDGCTCKPMPWSTAEQARHGRYAALEAEKAEREKKSQMAAAQPHPDKQPPQSTAARPSVPVIVGTPLRADEDLSAVMPAEEASGDVADRPAGTPLAVAAAGGESTAQPEAPSIEKANSAADAEKSPNAKPKRTPRLQPASASRVTRAAAPAQPTAGLFGGGPSKYVWPGDAPPPRYR